MKYRALDYNFSVEAGPDHPVHRVLADLADPGSTGDHLYRLAGGTGSWTVELDRTRLCNPSPEADALDALMADINSRAGSSRPHHLVLHAAALEYGGAGVLLPGEPGSGKSTLAGALIRAGFGYLTDEAAAIDPDSLEVAPYPKPLSLHRAAPAATAELVPADDLRPGAVSGPVPIRVIVFPSYAKGAATTLVPISRAEAAIEAANNSFNFLQDGARWLPVVARMVLSSWCGRLQMGDLSTAIDLVAGTLAA